MSDWEELAEDNISISTPAPIKSRWDDEDIDDIKDSWEDELSEAEDGDTEVGKLQDDATTSQSAQKIKPKRTIKSAIEERQKQEEEKKQMMAAKKAAIASNDQGNNDNLSPAERKRREQKLIEQSDMKNVEELFGGVSIDDSKRDDTFPLHTMEPKTKAEFEEYSEELVKKFKEFQNRSGYVAFLEQSFRSLCQPLKGEDIKKLVSVLTAVSNEKLKAEKDATKKKKSSKKQVVVKSDDFDDVDNDLYAGEYDDFM